MERSFTQTQPFADSCEDKAERTRGKLHQKLASLVGDLVKHGVDLQFAKKEMESLYIQAILQANNGNIGLSARALGMHRNTLSKHIKDLNINIERP